MSRKKAREGLFKLVFQNEFIRYEGSCEVFLENFSYLDDEAEFINQGIIKIQENEELINSNISDNLIDWTIDRLHRIDLSILKVSVYELLIDQTTPTAVVANEAVEIAKKYGSKDSSRLVNGILGTIIRSENL